MNQKAIGVIMILIGILLLFQTYSLQKEQNIYINQIILTTGSCFLDDGTCLHEEKNSVMTNIGYILATIILIFGIYITFFDKTTKTLLEHQKNITSALTENTKLQKEKDEFTAFLAGFDEREQKVLKTIKEQDGILQSTLRYKTNLSKAMLSNILFDLEKKGYISRKDKGKSKQIFLIKKY